MYTIPSSQYNTGEIYIDSAYDFVHPRVRAQGMLRFIVLFWQLPAVNSRIINNGTGNITLAAGWRDGERNRVAYIRTTSMNTVAPDAIATDKNLCQTREVLATWHGSFLLTNSTQPLPPLPPLSLSLARIRLHSHTRTHTHRHWHTLGGLQSFSL